jgi:MFS family permease
LYCDDRIFRTVAQSVLMFAPALGSIAMSIVSDSVGRKKNLTIGWSISLIGFLCTIFSTNKYYLIISLFLSSNNKEKNL